MILLILDDNQLWIFSLNYYVMIGVLINNVFT